MAIPDPLRSLYSRAPLVLATATATLLRARRSMDARCHAIALAVVMPLWPLVALGAAAAPPSVAFEEQAVIVEGLTPDAEVLLFGVGRGVEGFIPYQIRWAERLTGDANGSVRLELPLALPASSVWVATELATGAATLAAPPGSEVLEIEFPGRGAPAALRRLEDGRSGLEVLWVRPAGAGADSATTAGVWAARVRDGSGLDGDEREDRRMSVRLDRLEAIGASPPTPQQLAPGDLLVGVDTETLEIYTFRPER